jgi:cytochrome c oxidase subunit 3/cytochrome o ubiquinol oxidase subunit 3
MDTTVSYNEAALYDGGDEWKLPSRGPVGMYCLIAAEAAIFTIFIIAYLFYLGKSLSGPTQTALHTPWFLSVCLLSSSFTIHRAQKALAAGMVNLFTRWLLLTIGLSGIFLTGTALEWHHLIYDVGLTIRTNLFGTTYYSLVGLHAFHVTFGLLLMCLTACFALLRYVTPAHAGRIEVLAIYWHFVDTVWVVVFAVVYLIGR